MTQIVRGDVVLLSAGSLVHADGPLRRTLSGRKTRRSVDGPVVEPQAASDALFMGTSIVSGTGRMLVDRTGSGTSLGAIALTLTGRRPATAFDPGPRQFGMLIMRLTVFMVLFVLMVNAAMYTPLLESFLFAIALAVGLTPELFQMVVSVTLAHGALRMAARQVIVKRLSAIQNLGVMDVVCTDKTGTLTEARIRLERPSIYADRSASACWNSSI